MLKTIITSADFSTRNVALDSLCEGMSASELLSECADLESSRHGFDSVYDRVRALFFLYAIHRFHLPQKRDMHSCGVIPYAGYCALLERRFAEAIAIFLAAQATNGPSAALCSALAAAYRALAFQTLADQVRHSVRSVSGNQWMFRVGHPNEHPLRIRPELRERCAEGVFPILRESTPVRMDLTHSGWSDIFFLGMDYPEGARVLNISIDLAVRQNSSATSPRIPCPPVEAYLRVIDEPVLRLTSVDLQCSAEISSVAEVFGFAKDYLGLLKAGVIASGLVPPAMEGAEPLSDLLATLTGSPGRGIELVTKVNDIPKGSRLAVSTSLLASVISVCMRATRQIQSLTGTLEEHERRLVAARAILGEWLGGSGGGWQDSGGVWPGIKLIHGVPAEKGAPARGQLLPQHRVFGVDEVSRDARNRLQESLVLVHGGMAQDVGPILEMVTEKYLLRSEAEWRGRQKAIATLDTMLQQLRTGDIRSLGASTQENFDGPIQTIVPWAANLYTNTLIERTRGKFGDDFWGFWMLGGMSGGGMGFLFAPERKREAQEQMQVIMSETKRQMEHAVPFAMEPVVYDFAVNERGTEATLLQGHAALMPANYYVQIVPRLVRTEARLLSPARRTELNHFSTACQGKAEFSGLIPQLFDHLLPQAQASSGAHDNLEGLLKAYGFDREEHEQIQSNLASGRIGLAQNRLPVSTVVEDVRPGDVADFHVSASAQVPGISGEKRYRDAGVEALRDGRVAVVSMAGGIGSRWTRGAGVVKAINPFCKLAGRHRSFVEVHLAKSLRAGHENGTLLPHVITTSYLTHDAIAAHLEAESNYGYPGPLLLSPGCNVGLRMVPMERDLRFAWEETPTQLLDEQAQKVRESLHHSLLEWAQKMGEGSDYTDNIPSQCLHPVGHWYEIPNMLRNGTLARLLEMRPHLQYVMVHNIDTVGASVDPVLLGYHIEQGAAMTTEVIARHLEDRGGGLARIQDRVRLAEGLALPSEDVESRLSYYNSATYWIDIDQLLAVFGVTRADLADTDRISRAVRNLASRMPTYITLKDVKKRWGKGQEDIFPVAQFEKLWGDMTGLPELKCSFVSVPRQRGQQLKEVAQLDGWLRDGSAAYVNSLCEWGEGGRMVNASAR